MGIETKMETISQYLPNFSNIFSLSWIVFFDYYGWVVFLIGFFYVLWKMYFSEIKHQFIHNIEWEFLHIKVPKENRVSTLAVESVFAQMHALQSNPTTVQKYTEGASQPWYSLEIVSLGGKINFILRIPKKIRHVVEAAFYAQYPNIEISEINDYMENFEYDPEKTTDVDIWGTEVLLTEDFTLPIKTYKDFEHPTSEEKIIDPLGPLFETLALIQPYEFMGVQMLLLPVADDEWKSASDKKVKDLIGEEMPHETTFTGTLLKPLDAFAKLSYREMVLGGGGHGHGADEKVQKNNWMSMTDTEKERVGLVERKAGKAGYKTKIRWLYVAPKDKFDATKKSMLPGAYRHFSTPQSNKLKPDVKKTWTGVEHKISPDLEKPYIDYLVNKRKRRIFHGYKDRDTHLGNPMFVLNTEEIATLYHFPITTETTGVPSAVERVESKRSQAPANLPIAD